jgi:holo-[acyl-carrier protein] synthase
MIVGIGTDTLPIERMARELRRPGGGFGDAVFTEREISACRAAPSAPRALAACFAAKEAFAKAIGTGFGPCLGWRDVELFEDREGNATLVLHGAAERLAAERHVSHTWASVGSRGSVVVAMVLLES